MQGLGCGIPCMLSVEGIGGWFLYCVQDVLWTLYIWNNSCESWCLILVLAKIKMSEMWHFVSRCWRLQVSPKHH